MIVAWQELKRLVVNPSEALEGILARRGLGLSLALGTVGYYWRTLQISEAVFPPSLGGRAYFLLNFPLALGWTALIVSLIHLAYRMVGRGKGRWGDLLSLWGYTQLPLITLIVLAAAFLLLAPPIPSIDLGIAWVLFGLGVVLLLSLWNLILKFQAIKVCYDLSGKRLWAVIALALLFYGALSWAETTFVSERGLVPQKALRAMEPAVVPFTPGRRQVLLPFEKLTYLLRGPEKGEIVGFVPSKQEGLSPFTLGSRVRSIGRVVGMPGEVVELRKGRLALNGRLQNEPYLTKSGNVDFPPTEVPPGHFFIVGDNREVPLEEYGGGIVPERRIRGRMTDVGRIKWGFLLGKWRW